jgi:hypothetical protein
MTDTGADAALAVATNQQFGDGGVVRVVFWSVGWLSWLPWWQLVVLCCNRPHFFCSLVCGGAQCWWIVDRSVGWKSTVMIGWKSTVMTMVSWWQLVIL